MPEDYCGNYLEYDLTYVMQEVPAHEPGKGRVGDCYRTCIANLIGEPRALAVPHFVELQQQSGDEDWEDVRLARLWLRERGMDLLPVDRNWAIEQGFRYIVTVKSKTGPWSHAVIGQGGQVIHDPSGVGYSEFEYWGDDDPVEVLWTPYEPDPDELVQRWRRLESATVDSEQTV